MLTSTVKARFIKMKILFVMVICYLYLPSSFGKPLSTAHCKDDQLTYRDKEGQIKCWDLRKCPHSFGFKFQFIQGKIYDWGTFKIGCDACKQGITYSDMEDFSRCKNCTMCKENEIITGQCHQDKDEIRCTGTCMEGFYWSNETMSCFPCSQCCWNGNNTGCANVCSLESSNKECSQGSDSTGKCKERFYWSNTTKSCLPCSQCCRNRDNSSCINTCPPELSSKNCTLVTNSTDSMNPTNGTHSIDTGPTSPGTFPDGQDKKNPKDDDGSINPGQLVFVVLISLLVLCTLLILPCLILCKRYRLQPQNRTVIVAGLQVAAPGFSKLVSSSVESTEVNCYPIDENVALALREHDVPQNLDESFNDENDNISCQGGLVLNIRPKVKDMPLGERTHLCNKLNQRNNYYLDYRSLGGALGMKNSEIDQLSTKTSPTYCILLKYEEMDLEDFHKVLQEMKNLENYMELNGIEAVAETSC